MEFNFNEIRLLGGMEMLARQLVSGFMIGLHKSPYQGFSVEFAEHRLYNVGESTRHIDWKVYARTDRLYSRQYEEETNLRCLLAIDCSSSMYYPTGKSKIEFSMYAAAAISYVLHKQRDATGLCFFSDQIDELTTIKSSGTHQKKLFMLMEKKLNELNQKKSTDIVPLLHQIAEKIHKRSLVILFTDMFDKHTQHGEIFKALQHLKHCGHEVLLFHVTDHQTELHFDFDERPYQFTDLETGEQISLHPSSIQKAITLRLQEYRQEIKTKCLQLNIDYIESDAAGNFNEVLQAYLIKRTKMR